MNSLKKSLSPKQIEFVTLLQYHDLKKVCRMMDVGLETLFNWQMNRDFRKAVIIFENNMRQKILRDLLREVNGLITFYHNIREHMDITEQVKGLSSLIKLVKETEPPKEWEEEIARLEDPVDWLNELLYGSKGSERNPFMLDDDDDDDLLFDDSQKSYHNIQPTSSRLSVHHHNSARHTEATRAVPDTPKPAPYEPVITNREQPETHEEPKAENQQPLIQDQEIETQDPEPVTISPQPITQDQEIDTNEPEPVTEDKEPETRDAEPESREHEPKIINDGPTTMDDGPETKDHGPTSHQKVFFGLTTSRPEIWNLKADS